jgi:hypothetical protein
LKDWLTILFGTLAILCLVLCTAMYVENRHLLSEMSLISGKCVPPETHQILLEACESINYVNKRDQAYLRRVMEITDERRSGADGKIWSAAGQGGAGGGRERGKGGVGGP